MKLQPSFALAGLVVVAACSNEGPRSAHKPAASDAGPHASSGARADASARTGAMDGAIADASRPDPGDSPLRYDAAPRDARVGTITDPLPDASHPIADPSLPIHGEAAVLDDDSSVFCVVRTSGDTHGHLEAVFRRLPSDADEAAEEPYRFAPGRVRASFSCSDAKDASGRTERVQTQASNDDDVVSADCPSALPYGSAPDCTIDEQSDDDASSPTALHRIRVPGVRDTDAQPFASRTRCIGSITSATTEGQVTGFVPELMLPSGEIDRSYPLYNESLMRDVTVGGTDEGAIFFAQGKLYFSFGDTSDIDANDPVTMALEMPPRWRSNVLAHASRFDTRAGLRFDGFELDSDGKAKENVVSEHKTDLSPGAEFTAIPLAGLGLTSRDGHRYRFLWFVSVHRWLDSLLSPQFESNYSTLAYSIDESARWTRMDAAPTPGASFGPGTIWFDRYTRLVYFFGVDPDHGAIRLARVKSSVAALTDAAQYRYWTGTGWSADPSAAIELVPATANHAPRSEMSIAYNPAADVWMMMVVNWFTAPAADPANQVELWQAPSLVGPWVKLEADAQLPNGKQVLNYGPMVSEHTLREAGLEVPFLLSQMYPVYNVHLWSFRIHVADATSDGACPF